MRFRLGEAPGGRQSPPGEVKIRKLTKPHFPGHPGLYLIAPTFRPSFSRFFPSLKGGRYPVLIRIEKWMSQACPECLCWSRKHLADLFLVKMEAVFLNELPAKPVLRTAACFEEMSGYEAKKGGL